MTTTSSDILIIRVQGNRAEDRIDPVAAESSCTLVVNDEPLVSLLCTPHELDALAIGFLLSEGLLESRESLLSIHVDDKKATVRIRLKDLPTDMHSRFHKKTITSGCGHGVTFTDAKDLISLPRDHDTVHLSPEKIQNLMRKFRKLSDLFLKTGGVHSAALTDQDNILLFAEDIGRHNAVDKLIGKAFLAWIPLDDKILLSSGRISGEIMTKVVRNRIPVLVSRTAPTCFAINMAEDHGVTLIGFVRRNRMNIYTHPLRIKL
ncbi:MAG: formate dehydrogenase accessory sulfurtransferase FdhD [Desulfobulbaceae bacterium]|nr:formate dehydrogenase accessory sulfurtransferase FdhD [Desulfobulbaceae bacterium]